MQNRSWLIIPADSEKKLARAAATGADAVVIDLERTVDPARKGMARDLAREWLTIHRTQITEGRKLGRWVRINSLDSRHWREDLVAVLPSAPDGIVLPRGLGPISVQQLAAEIYELEQSNGVPSGSTRILPLAAQTAQSALAIPSYVEAPLPRLAGLAWDTDALTQAIGATRAQDETGGWTDTFRFIRAQLLLAAHARGVMAIETMFADPRDEAGLARAVATARADGFTGMLAIHPAQVAAINTAFTPSDEELAEARAILDLAGGETLMTPSGIDRRTLDPTALRTARCLLGVAT